MRKITLVFSMIFVSILSYGQIIVTQTQSPQQLVDNVLTGSGVAVSNVTYNYSNPDAQNIQTTIGFFDNNGTGFPITSGVILATGDVSLAIGPNNSGSQTDNNGIANPDPSDPDLDAIGTATINNECILEFDFVPIGDTIVFNYIFASEEYPEFSPSNFNDAFGFFISGPGFNGPYSNNGENIAIIPGTTTPVTINNINPTTNANLYTDNANGADLQYDGHTVTLQASASVQCGETYHIKLAIGDAGDQSYDSAVFLEANSFSSNGADISILPVDLNGDPLSNNELYEGCTGAQILMVNPSGYTDSSYVVNLSISGTATNGVDYSTVNNSYTIPPGQDSLTVTINALADVLGEVTETLIIETYYVSECGDTVTVSETINIIDVAPSFNVLTTDTTFTCPFDEFDVTALTDGGVPNLTYDWGALGTGQTVTLPGDLPGLNSYTVNVTDACGITSQGTFNVTLNAAPVPTIGFSIDGSPNNLGVTLCPSEEANIEVSSVNNPFDATQITYDWSPIAGNTDNITVSPNVETWFYVDVFDGCYTVTDSVKISIGTLNLTSITISEAEGCPDQGIFNPGSIEVLPAGLTYTLVGGGDTFGPQAGNNFTTLTGNITYALNVVNADGCEVDTLVTVGSLTATVDADWVSASLQDVTCNGDQNGAAEIENITGGLNNGPYDVSWTNQDGTTSTQNGITTGNGSTNNTLFGGQWVVTVVEQGSGCAWSEIFDIFEPEALELDLTNYSSPSCFELNDGNLTVLINGGNGITEGTGNVSITNSSNTVLNTGVSDLTVNRLPTDTYSVAVTDDNGCAAAASILIEEPGELGIEFTITNPNCYGIATGFIQIDTVINYQGTNYTDDSLYFQWVPNPSGNDGIGQNFTNKLAEGSYQLKITDGNDCYKFFDFTIEYPDSIYFDELGFEGTVCRNQIPFDNGQGQVFAAAAGGSNGNGSGTNFNYLWTEDATSNTTTNSTWGNRNPGYYTIVATNDLECSITETIYVDSLSPEAIFTITSPDFTSAYEGTAVVNTTITNESINYAFSEDPNADTTFIWTFGFDGETPYVTDNINETINKQYLEEGVYDVCLVVIENLNGCIDTTCQEITIYDFPVLVTPNVFTPGANGAGDGINDEFLFPNTAIVEFKCSVFDRWGKQVFQFNSITDAWDGANMNNGNPCTDGVYFYMYEGISSNDTEFKGQGDVHLIRE